MSAQWRLFVAALHFVRHRRISATGSAQVLPQSATRFVPLAGICVGLVAAGAYWITAQIWPTSIAIAVSMLSTVLITENLAELSSPQAAGSNLSPLYSVFAVLIKYNVLMALSSARAPVSLPPFLTLGLIMVVGQAASRALVVSVMAIDAPAAHPVSAMDLTIALLVGLTPAILLGLPGLFGLVAAIAMRLVLTATILSKLRAVLRERWELTQQATEICFYLGALASWSFV